MEIRDPERARRWVLHGLTIARAMPLNQARVEDCLRWCLEILGKGNPLPMSGFVFDVGHMALGAERDQRLQSDTVSWLPARLARTYEDYVLGKAMADSSFERGSDALMRYEQRDRDKALAFLITQFRERAGIEGMLFSPAVLKTILRQVNRNFLDDMPDADEEEQQAIAQQLTALSAAVRNLGEVLGTEDIFELEHGTAVAEFGQRLALRQVLGASLQFTNSIPQGSLRPVPRHHHVATNIADEDTYPVGGFTSISTRGTIESLLHSQLAFMEEHDRPDLFDIKFLRDELLYYSRDESQFFRRRRNYLIVLCPDLSEARFKDSTSPYQRIVMLLALVHAAISNLQQWLSTEALVFRIALLPSGDDFPLQPEFEMLQTLFREEIENKTVELMQTDSPQLIAESQRLARRSLCQTLVVSSAPAPDWPWPDSVFVSTLRVDQQSKLRCSGTRPGEPQSADSESAEPQTVDAFANWQEILLELLREWA